MEKGKIKLTRDSKTFLSTLKRFLDKGWKLCGVTEKDATGAYWFILSR